MSDNSNAQIKCDVCKEIAREGAKLLALMDHDMDIKASIHLGLDHDQTDVLKHNEPIDNIKCARCRSIIQNQNNAKEYLDRFINTAFDTHILRHHEKDYRQLMKNVLTTAFDNYYSSETNKIKDMMSHDD